MRDQDREIQEDDSEEEEDGYEDIGEEGKVGRDSECIK